ncbi:MAG: PLP-dependent aminotransferase family protein [Oscillospiraceae bacterium]|nr:PLP-dependent aminotransferase family protein [Oscillospiraceae bacterium]
MNYSFSDRIGGVKPSAIREILKLSSDPSVIAFSAGNPSADSFPKEEIEQFASEILGTTPVLALQYGLTEGYAPLREALKARCRQVYHSFDDGIDELIVTTGAQQVIDLLTKVICNEGDTVIAEGPSFVAALSSFKSYGAEVRQVAIDEDGMDLDELETAVKTARNPRFIYCIPNFQNPTGFTMPLEKRVGVLNIARKYNLLVLEDNAYGDIRFKGEHLPTIKSMDDEGRVVYAGSMSKLLAPGLRVGFVSAAPDLISKMVVAKQVGDVHTPVLNQMLCHSFLTRSDVPEHIKRINALCLRKSDLMLSELDAKVDGLFKYTRPQGGLFIWCTLPDGVDMMEFSGRAVRQRVAVVPGNAFYADDVARRQSFRLNFSSPSDENIIEGVGILAEVARGMC